MAAGYCRAFNILVTVDVMPSVYITKWDVLPQRRESRRWDTRWEGGGGGLCGVAISSGAQRGDTRKCVAKSGDHSTRRSKVELEKNETVFDVCSCLSSHCKLP